MVVVTYQIVLLHDDTRHHLLRGSFFCPVPIRTDAFAVLTDCSRYIKKFYLADSRELWVVAYVSAFRSGPRSCRVSCGSFFSESGCKECPGTGGASNCRGDCTWSSLGGCTLQGTLVNSGNSCDSKQCSECEGDCDNDAGCLPGLKCFYRSSSSTIVPGCGGGGGGDYSTTDYCYKPPTTTTTTTTTTTIAAPPSACSPSVELSTNLLYNQLPRVSSTYSSSYRNIELTNGKTCSAGGGKGDMWHSASGQTNPWVEIPLRCSTVIDRVVINNRCDCCSERINGIRVFVIGTQGTKTQCGSALKDEGKGKDVTVVCPFSAGNSIAVRLEKSGVEVINLAEVMAYKVHSCIDIADWRSRNGRSCKDYVDYKWCESRTYGSQWTFGSFADWANDGKAANDVYTLTFFAKYCFPLNSFAIIPI